MGCTVAGLEDIDEARARLPGLPDDLGPTPLVVRDAEGALLGVAAISVWPSGVRLDGAWAVDAARHALSPSLLRGLRACSGGGPIDAEVREPLLARELEEIGFELLLQSERWEGPLPADSGEGVGDIRWEDFEAVGAAGFVAALESTCAPGDAALRIHGSAAAALEEWTVAATAEGAPPDRRGWWVLRRGADAVGVVLGVVDPGPPATSGLQYISLEPTLRGGGRGRALAREALARLRGLGAAVHRDATDVDNAAMASIFEGLGMRRIGGLWRLRRAPDPPPPSAACLGDVLDILAAEGQRGRAGVDPARVFVDGRIDDRAGRVEVEWRPEGRIVEIRHVALAGVKRDRFIPLMVAANRVNAALWLPGFVFEEDAARLVYRQALLLDSDDTVPRARLMRGLWTVLVAATDFRDTWAAFGEAGLPGRGHGVSRNPLRRPVDPGWKRG